MLVDCETKGVVQSIKRDLINNPNLQAQTQMKLKQMYRASQIQQERKKGGNYMGSQDAYGEAQMSQ